MILNNSKDTNVLMNKIETSVSLVDDINLLYGPRKVDSRKLAEIYRELGYTSKYFRVYHCGDFLEFAHEFDYETGEFSSKGHLVNANFCRDLLCPMCQWRKSLKQLSNLSNVLNCDEIKDKYKVIVITLTIPNVPYKKLSVGIDKLNNGFYKLMKSPKYKRTFKGYFKAIEVTINENTKTFHPHIHMLALVNLDYASTGSDYISHDELLNDWRNATKDQSITQVDIRLAYDSKDEIVSEPNYKSNLQSAALEAAKYCAKIPSSCYELEIIRELLKGLSNRRMYSYGGIMKEVYRELRLEDAESGDLINIDSEVPKPVMSYIVTYGFTTSGYQILNTRLKGDNADIDI